MTNEEAINYLHECSEAIGDTEYHTLSYAKEALNMAIKALSQQTEDAISRQAAINAVCDSDCHINHRDCGLYSGRCFTVWRLEKLPSVIPSRPTKPSEDAISRQAVEKIINDIRDCISVEGYCAILERLNKLPSVKPQDCDTCEVGNPCLYCKHEFEPQESEGKDGNI